MQMQYLLWCCYSSQTIRNCFSYVSLLLRFVQAIPQRLLCAVPLLCDVSYIFHSLAFVFCDSIKFIHRLLYRDHLHGRWSCGDVALSSAPLTSLSAFSSTYFLVSRLSVPIWCQWPFDLLSCYIHEVRVAHICLDNAACTLQNWSRLFVPSFCCAMYLALGFIVSCVIKIYFQVTRVGLSSHVRTLPALYVLPNWSGDLCLGV